MKYAIKPASSHEGHPWREFGFVTDRESPHDLENCRYVALVYRGRSTGPFNYGFWYEWRFYRQNWDKRTQIGKVYFRDRPKDRVVLMHFARILKKAARDRRRWRH